MTKSAKLQNSTMSISKLSDDTIADILSRLPVKSVTKFKCVSKSWCSLISSSHFAKFHLNRVVSDVNLRCNRLFLKISPLQSIDVDDVDNSHISLDFMPQVDGFDDSVSVEGSCNGLLCVVSDYDQIVVFNPTIRDLIELPKPSISMKKYTAYGFGYDSSTDDYKLFRVFNPNNAHVSGAPVLAEIFSFRNNCWRIIDDIDPSFSVTRPGVFLNGALHWLVTGTACLNIVAFDLATEQFESMSFPKPEVKRDDCKLVVTHDCLSVACNIYPDLEIWAMKEYGAEESWGIVCTILDDEYMYEEWMITKCSTKNGEILLEVDGRDLVIYNPQQSTFRRIGVEGDCECFETAVYFETLVSPRIGP